MKPLLVLMMLIFLVLSFGCPVEEPTGESQFVIDESFKPQPRANLSEETKRLILQDYLATVSDSRYFDNDKNEFVLLTINDVWIEKYYGIYNDCIAILLFNRSNAPRPMDLEIEFEVVIDKVSFFYNHMNMVNVVAYREGKLYELQNAYEQGLLTKDDLKSIAYYHNEDIVFPERIPVDMSLITLEEKTIWSGNINGNFTDSGVIIGIDRNFRNWRFYVSDFEAAGIEISSVRSIIPPLSYFIVLRNKGKQNVVDAIKKLEKLDFVRYAHPDYIVHIW